MTSKPTSEDVRLIERMETAALLHPDWMWASLMLEGAAALRRALGMPPRTDPREASRLSRTKRP